MKILMIIHGYPPEYNAGSEVYTQSICNELHKKNEVIIVSREENDYEPDFAVRKTFTEHGICHYLINMARGKDGYNHPAINERFIEIIENTKPDIAHIGHLNHLSTGIIHELSRKQIPILYTLHDFWLMCPRGQFLQRNFDGKSLYKLCDKQQDLECANNCYKMYYSGIDIQKERRYWTDWIGNRMSEMKSIVQEIDLFHAPSVYLQQRFIKDFGIPENKIFYMDYGFPVEYLQPVKPMERDNFTFGYIGTHIPSKGVNQLIEAFSMLGDNTRLKIFGRVNGQSTTALRRMAEKCMGRVEFCGEYINKNLATTVFNNVDCIVVPSIWAENSPLVIHEAQACKVPVITADFGGMKEYVHHKVNGLLFDHRNVNSLKEQMEFAYHNQVLMKTFGRRGYLYSENGAVPDIETHCENLTATYKKLIERKSKIWRITLDTNPEDCNLSCIMCEEHSQYSNFKQELKRESGLSRRVMPKDWIKKIITEAYTLGVREIIPTTMGDPLVSDNFIYIANQVRQLGMKMNITHNGTFPGKSIQEWAEIIIPDTTDIKISWNGASSQTAESIMNGLKFNETLEKTKLFIESRDQWYESHGHYCQITLQLTFMTINMHEIEGIIKLAAELGIDRIKGHHLWTHFSELQELSYYKDEITMNQWNDVVSTAYKAIDDYKRKDGSKIRLENFHPISSLAHGAVPSYHICPFLGKELWISATGKISPCCAPDKLRNQLGDFGNIENTTIQNVLISEQYQDLVRNYKTKELCKKCAMRRPGLL